MYGANASVSMFSVLGRFRLSHEYDGYNKIHHWNIYLAATVSSVCEKSSIKQLQELHCKLLATAVSTCRICKIQMQLYTISQWANCRFTNRLIKAEQNINKNQVKPYCH